MRCKDCWWFKRYPLQDDKGQCLVYGFTMNSESVICCDYERGETNE